MSIEINDEKKVTISLFLQFKNLTSFPENIDFKNFKNMTAIFLDYNNIDLLPESIGNLTHLKHISMTVLLGLTSTHRSFMINFFLIVYLILI